ncbi:Uncharacterised protein [Mycobacteroides abscessus subsp. abscessus]|nr:Uncharacterised protein [Mycobacteroides abscessus subsp. abscessus]
MRIMLTVAAIALLGVGLFPNNRGLMHILHTQSAWFLNYFIIGMIIAVRWLLPGVSRESTFVVTVTTDKVNAD